MLLLMSSQAPRRVTELSFVPNSLSTFNLPDSNETLLAAGGQEAELHLSLYAPPSQPYFGGDDGSLRDTTTHFGRQRWRSEVPLDASISPDGRTLLSVGDSPDIYLHRVTGGAHVTFSLMTKLSLEPYITTMSPYSYNTYTTPYHTNYPVPASFSTAFSANGSKFAVASQEGVVAVWDVRSTKPLKVIQTDKSRSPASPRSEATGLASGWIYDTPWDWGRGTGKAPGWGVRSVKFSPQGAGREVLTFTEHTSLLHVMDARTFEDEEIVRVPNFDTPPPSRPPTARPRSNSPPLVRSPEPSQSLPPPARIVLFSGALEDTFRIPSADSTGRRRRSTRLHQRGESSGAEDVDGIVVVPTLGDTELDEDVRRLLDSRHARIANALRGVTGGEERPEDMDIDELESDCLSSYAPSRASSPAPSPAASSQLQDRQQLSSERTATSVIRRERERVRDPLALRRTSNQPLRRHRRHLGMERAGEAEVEQDLAGTCFDPSGEYVYVAAVHGISEWKVRGAEQRWWSGSSWA
ncbi:hypothetical protein EIP86_000561 [Pleurotus ostreatoroseus]|nr:hypothetical protein EIP86_000561 [Pleurotus ostreatoroseus]